MRKLQLILIIIFLNSTNSFSQGKTFVAENYKTENFDIAIFPKTYIEFLPEKRFTPTKAQIDLAETELRINLKQINSRKINQTSSPIIDKNLKKYRRQYFGYIDENGDEILIINSFWKERKDKKEVWLNDYIRVLDGGSYYWGIKYNITKKKLFELIVNGYA